MMRSTRSTFYLAGLAVGSALSLLKLFNDSSWLGVWNETSASIGTALVLGGAACATSAAIVARRNWARMPVHLVRPGQVPVHLEREVLPTLLVGVALWAIVSATGFAATLGVSRPGLLYPQPILVALLATVLQVLVGHAAGRALPLFAAIPLVLSVCFVAPVVLAALDTSGFAVFSTVNNGVLVPEMAIGEEFYSLQLAMVTGSVVALGLLLAGPRRAIRAAATLFAGATLALAVYAFVAQPPRDHLADRSGAKFECTTQSGVTVCVALDDVRFMPRLLDAALEVRAALPEEATPSTYVQVGLATQTSEEARLSLVATRSGDAVADIAGVAARWRTCEGTDPNVLLGRELWLLATVRGDREALKFEVVQRAMPPSEDASSAWAEVQFPQCVGGEGGPDAG